MKAYVFVACLPCSMYGYAEAFPDMKTIESFTDPEEGMRWKEQVQEAFPGKDVWYDPLSLVVCAHTGPDAFGVGVSVAYDPE